MWYITVLAYRVRRDVPGWLTWPLVLTTSWGHHQNLGLERLKSLYTDCSVNLLFWGLGTSCCECIYVWLHRRWSAHDVLVILHICSASALCQYLMWCFHSLMLVAKVTMIGWFDWPEKAFLLELRGWVQFKQHQFHTLELSSPGCSRL